MKSFAFCLTILAVGLISSCSSPEDPVVNVNVRTLSSTQFDSVRINMDYFRLFSTEDGITGVGQIQGWLGYSWSQDLSIINIESVLSESFNALDIIGLDPDLQIVLYRGPEAILTSVDTRNFIELDTPVDLEADKAYDFNLTLDIDRDFDFTGVPTLVLSDLSAEVIER